MAWCLQEDSHIAGGRKLSTIWLSERIYCMQ